MPTKPTPEEALAALEEAVINGEEVSASQLAEAREGVRIEALRAEGERNRSTLAALREGVELRERTKAEVARMFADVPDLPDLLELYDAAVAALQVLADGVAGHNARIQAAGTLLLAGGVPCMSWDGQLPDEWDSQNWAHVGQGNEVSSITSSGVAFRKEVPALWVRAAVQSVAEDSPDGLRLPYGGLLREQLRGDKPDTIRHRA